MFLIHFWATLFSFRLLKTAGFLVSVGSVSPGRLIGPERAGACYRPPAHKL